MHGLSRLGYALAAYVLIFVVFFGYLALIQRWLGQDRRRGRYVFGDLEEIRASLNEVDLWAHSRG